jgi:biopolymer transport protein ExbB
VAPLLGLLGTVTGLVRCFQVIQEKATTVNPISPGDLAGGIWEALLTTVFGLVVAIPAYAAYNILAHRINGFVSRLQGRTAELVNLLTPAPSTSFEEKDLAPRI